MRATRSVLRRRGGRAGRLAARRLRIDEDAVVGEEHEVGQAVAGHVDHLAHARLELAALAAREHARLEDLEAQRREHPPRGAEGEDVGHLLAAVEHRHVGVPVAVEVA
ncbi:MAG: hypothetical protein ACK559_27315, partial [bacterium]